MALFGYSCVEVDHLFCNPVAEHWSICKVAMVFSWRHWCTAVRSLPALACQMFIYSLSACPGKPARTPWSVHTRTISNRSEKVEVLISMWKKEQAGTSGKRGFHPPPLVFNVFGPRLKGSLVPVHLKMWARSISPGSNGPLGPGLHHQPGLMP
jgi:hypothetical protein